eukprot:1698587-Karenia_brevis.AAC.1
MPPWAKQQMDRSKPVDMTFYYLFTQRLTLPSLTLPRWLQDGSKMTCRWHWVASYAANKVLALIFSCADVNVE